MNAIVSITQALEPIAQTEAPEYTVEVSYPTAQISVDLPNGQMLVYSIDFDTETDSTRMYSHEDECLVMTVTVEDNCTVTAYDDEGDVVYETMIKTPDWIHTDAVVEIEESMTTPSWY